MKNLVIVSLMVICLSFVSTPSFSEVQFDLGSYFQKGEEIMILTAPPRKGADFLRVSIQLEALGWEKIPAEDGPQLLLSLSPVFYLEVMKNSTLFVRGIGTSLEVKIPLTGDDWKGELYKALL